MKTLPLLPSDFEHFSWQVPVGGNATEQQLLDSFDTLLNLGPTKNFSIQVWNDLVDILYQAIVQSGHTWDNKYGTYKDTRMMFQYDPLTSSRFNAVTWNIAKLINLTWRWTVEYTRDGYIGDRPFVGVSEVGESADFFYAWYLIDYARVLNLLIDVLKNVADFGEISSKNIIPMIDYCDVHSGDGRRVIYTQIINVLSESIVRNVESAPINLYELSKTIDEVTVRSQKGQSMSHEDIVKSISYMNMRAFGIRWMHHRNIIKVLSHAKVYAREGKKIELQEHIFAMPKEFNLVSGDAMIMQHEYDINTIDYVNLVSAVPKYMEHENIINTIDSVVVSNNKPEYMTVNEILQSISYADIKARAVAKIGIEQVIKTIDDVKVTIKKPIKMVVEEVVKTISYFKLSVEDTWLYPIKKGTNLYIRQVYSSNQNDTELIVDHSDWLDPIQNGTNLYIRQMYEVLNNNKEE